MPNIKISSEELLRFGGIEYCMSRKNCFSLQNCQVTLSGKPGPLELMIFEQYLSKNKITLKSLRIADGKELYKINGYKVLTESETIDPKLENNQKILERINSRENQELWSSINLTKEYAAFIKGKTLTDRLKEKENENLNDISYNARKLMLEKEFKRISSTIN